MRFVKNEMFKLRQFVQNIGQVKKTTAILQEWNGNNVHNYTTSQQN
jgi:hypothetical protein